MKHISLLATTILFSLQSFAQTLQKNNTSDCNMYVIVNAMGMNPSATCTINYTMTAFTYIYLAAGTSYTASVSDLSTTPSGTWRWYSLDLYDATTLGGIYNFGSCTFTK